MNTCILAVSSAILRFLSQTNINVIVITITKIPFPLGRFIVAGTIHTRIISANYHPSRAVDDSRTPWQRTIVTVSQSLRGVHCSKISYAHTFIAPAWPARSPSVIQVRSGQRRLCVYAVGCPVTALPRRKSRCDRRARPGVPRTGHIPRYIGSIRPFF